MEVSSYPASVNSLAAAVMISPRFSSRSRGRRFRGMGHLILTGDQERGDPFLQAIQEFTGGPLPVSSNLPFTTSEQTFLSGGTTCAARVYRPASHPSTADDTRPVIVMGHGFGGVRALRLYAYAERFVAAGYLVVVFDYRGFGESEGSPRQLLDVGMQLQDWRAALSFARGLPSADRSGSSRGAPRSAEVTSSPWRGRSKGSPRSSRRSHMSAVPQRCGRQVSSQFCVLLHQQCATRSRRC